MGFFTYDTSVIISRGMPELPGQSDSFLWSSVVLLELTAKANDESERKVYERLFLEYAKDNSLIVPDDKDWQLASKILYWLTQGRRKREGGKLSRLKPGESQRMALDALIAVGARRWRATLVTENWDDFKAIHYYCKDLKIIKSAEFLA